MEKSKFNDATLMVSVEHQIAVGNNDAIEATVQHQICAYHKKDGSIDTGVDYMDIYDVKFLGIPIKPGYNEYKSFINKMDDLGVDVEELINEACVGIVTANDVNHVEVMFSKMFINKAKK